MDEIFKLVVVGHVDHGKSTIIGRLLADSNSLPEGKLEQVKQFCKKNSKPFEYAFLLDALKDEQSQGITIDAARIFFSTSTRKYLILDAPGHIEFLRNMVTGAANAYGALLVIDGLEGIQENSKRHATLLSMLGVQQVVVLVNKMDLVDYSQSVFEAIRTEFETFLTQLKIDPLAWIPVSGREGEQIVRPSPRMKWYEGSCVLEVLDQLRLPPSGESGPLRMFIQDVYKFTNFGDQRRIIAGNLDSGTLKVGDSLTFYPSMKRGKVKSIENFPATSSSEIQAGHGVGFTLEEQIYLTRGELLGHQEESQICVSSQFQTNIFWLGKLPLEVHKDYGLRLGSRKVSARITRIESVMDASSLEVIQGISLVERNMVAQCLVRTKSPLAFDTSETGLNSSRFVLVDNYDIAGGGIITGEVEDAQSKLREEVKIRNTKWESGFIAPAKRAEKYNQKASLILVTGSKDAGKKPIARALEMELFESGKIVYFLGIGNILYGVDADIKGKEPNSTEHIRRMSEVSHLMLDAGMILILTAVDLKITDLEMISTVVDRQRIVTVWVGERSPGALDSDVAVDPSQPENAVQAIKAHLQERCLIFAPD